MRIGTIFLGALAALAAVAGDSRAAADTLRLELQRAVFLGGEPARNISGLALAADGWLYLSDDNGPSPDDGWDPAAPVLYRVRLDSLLDPRAIPRIAAVSIGPSPRLFAGVAEGAGKSFKFDLEGVTAVGPHRFWLVDERDRLLLEADLDRGELTTLAGAERLLAGQEDLFQGGINFGFEGVAVVDSTLFICNEMQPAVILSYDLRRNFAPGARIVIEQSPDLTDLCADRGFLYALNRTGSLVYKLDPAAGRVLAVAAFGPIADRPEYRYRNHRDHYRNSEGLALSGQHLLIALDGTFQSIMADPQQQSPLVLVFHRPPGF